MLFTYSSVERMNELVEKANKSLRKIGISEIVIDSVKTRKVQVGENAFLEPIYKGEGFSEAELRDLRNYFDLVIQ